VINLQQFDTERPTPGANPTVPVVATEMEGPRVDESQQEQEVSEPKVIDYDV